MNRLESFVFVSEKTESNFAEPLKVVAVSSGKINEKRLWLVMLLTESLPLSVDGDSKLPM